MKAAALPLIFLCCVPLYSQEQHDPLTGLVKQWVNIEALFYTEKDTGEALVDFLEAGEAYTNSELFRQYEGVTQIPEEKEKMRLFTSAFAEAVRRGDKTGAENAAADIQNMLLSWQRFEYRVSDTLFRQFFRLFIIFIFLTALLFILIQTLYRKLQNSRNREQDSADFSWQIMLAQEQERSRISAELHDTALQDLGRLIHRTEAEQNPELLEIEQNIVDQIRSTCKEIMPPDFTRLSLADSLTQLCMNFEERTGIECRIGIQEFTVGELAAEKQLQCYRIVQEALTNIEKHANAKEAALTARNSRRIFPGKSGIQAALLVCISDDGPGFPDGAFPPADLSSSTMGIRGMYRRTALLGGELVFKSEAGQGVTVRLEIPLGEGA